MHAFRRQVIQDMAALRCEHDLVTPTGQCPADQCFVVTIAVNIGRIE
jgi:hypothetical protein